MRAGPQDVLTTVRKRIELVVNEIADAESIAMLRTAMSELDLALAQSDTEPDPTKVICPNCTHQFTAISVTDQERLRAQSNAEPTVIKTTGYNMEGDGGPYIRPANQRPTVCYCKPGECSAPKPEWCVGRRYADGFREANAKQVAGHSTPAMRARIRELSRPDSDDYDRAVIAVLDDFEALAQSDAEPVAWQYRGELANGTWSEWTLFNPYEYKVEKDRHGEHDPYPWEFRPLYAAPPRPDASEMDQLKADLRNTYQRLETTQVSEEGWKKRCQFIEAELDEARARAADRSGK